MKIGQSPPIAKLPTVIANYRIYQKIKTIKIMGYQKDSNKRDYVSPQGFKRCYECGQWHDAKYDRCAPCKGLTDRHTPIGRDQDGYEYTAEEIPPK